MDSKLTSRLAIAPISKFARREILHHGSLIISDHSEKRMFRNTVRPSVLLQWKLLQFGWREGMLQVVLENNHFNICRWEFSQCSLRLLCTQPITSPKHRLVKREFPGSRRTVPCPHSMIFSSFYSEIVITMVLYPLSDYSIHLRFCTDL